MKIIPFERGMRKISRMEAGRRLGAPREMVDRMLRDGELTAVASPRGSKQTVLESSVDEALARMNATANSA